MWGSILALMPELNYAGSEQRAKNFRRDSRRPARWMPDRVGRVRCGVPSLGVRNFREAAGYISRTVEGGGGGGGDGDAVAAFLTFASTFTWIQRPPAISGRSGHGASGLPPLRQRSGLAIPGWWRTPRMLRPPRNLKSSRAMARRHPPAARPAGGQQRGLCSHTDFEARKQMAQ